jgi:PilZ domain-containing protein
MALSMWPRKAHVAQNRRADFRTFCVGATVIDILSPQPRSSVQVHVLDVSASGLMLSLPFPLAPGALIRIEMTDAIAKAEVRYCTCEGSEYHVGVKVDEIIPKDR